MPEETRPGNFVFGRRRILGALRLPDQIPGFWSGLILMKREITALTLISAHVLFGGGGMLEITASELTSSHTLVEPIP